MGGMMMKFKDKWGFTVVFVVAAVIFVVVFFKGAVYVFSPGSIAETVPAHGAVDIPLYKEIVINTKDRVERASVMVTAMTGETRIEGDTVVFKPRRVFMPDTWYDVKAQIYRGDSKEEVNFSFKTVDVGDKMWVEIDLSDMNRVTVYKGKKAVRVMLASGGIPGGEYETPKGIFAVGDKGESFFTPKFGQGGLYWVRVYESYFMHSMPRDKDWNIIPEELEKLGTHASHGCIRLLDEDAIWVYENVPRGSMIVVHD